MDVTSRRRKYFFPVVYTTLYPLHKELKVIGINKSKRGTTHCTPLFRCPSADTDTFYRVSRIHYFDLDQYIDPDGLRIPAEISQVRCGRNSVGVGLGTSREVDHAISSNGARRGACVGDHIQIRVTCHSRLQDRCSKAPIRVNYCIHIDGTSYSRKTSIIGRAISCS